MTERKPARESWESWVDRQIREAKERGEFDNLPGTGKPLASIDGNPDDMWWIKQWLKREDLSFTPPVLALRKSVDDMFASVGRLRSEDKVREVVAELNARIREVNRTPQFDGPPSNLYLLDVDEVLTRWRQQRVDVAVDEPPAAPVDTDIGPSTVPRGGFVRLWARIRDKFVPSARKTTAGKPFS